MAVAYNSSASSWSRDVGAEPTFHRHSYHEAMDPVPAFDRSMLMPRTSLPTPTSFLQAVAGQAAYGRVDARYHSPSPVSPGVSAGGLPPNAFLHRARSFASPAADDFPSPATVVAEDTSFISPVPLVHDAFEAIAPVPVPSAVPRNKLKRERDERSEVNSSPAVEHSKWDKEQGAGVSSWQINLDGIVVGRRTDNNWINGTKLLNVIKRDRDERARQLRLREQLSGEFERVHQMTRGRRDGILKQEKERDVVRGGPMNVKGVWIPMERALALAEEWGAAHLFFPLFEADIADRVTRPTPYVPAKPLIEFPNRVAAAQYAAAEAAENFTRPLTIAIPRALSMSTSASFSGSDMTASPYPVGVLTPQQMFRHSFDASAAYASQVYDDRSSPSAAEQAAAFARRMSHPVLPTTDLYQSPPPSYSMASSYSAPPVAFTQALPISPRSHDFGGSPVSSYVFTSPTLRQAVPLMQPQPRRMTMEEVLEPAVFDGGEEDVYPAAKRVRYQ